MAPTGTFSSLYQRPHSPPLCFPLQAESSAAAAAALTVAHQAALLRVPVATWLHGPSRSMTQLVDANREGLVSLPGYVALCYAGSAAASLLQVPHVTHTRLSDDTGTSTGGRRGQKGHRREVAYRTVGVRWATLKWLAQLALWALIAWCGMFAVARFVQPVSRRWCNTAYVLWVLAMALTMLLAAAVVELASVVAVGCSCVDDLASAVSKHQLAAFLAANVLTGLVNLSMDTLHANNAVAGAVLSAYTCAWSSVPLLLEWWRQRQRGRAQQKHV